MFNSLTQSVIHIPASNGSVNLLKLDILSGIYVELKDTLNERTALHFSALAKEVKGEKETPLHLAVVNGPILLANQIKLSNK